MYQILKLPTNSVVGKFMDTLGAWNIKATIDDDVLKYFAKEAVKERIGARGLETVFKKFTLVFEKCLPKSGIEEFNLSIDMVDGTTEPLGAIKGFKELKAKKAKRQNTVDGYCDYIKDTRGATLIFTLEAEKIVLTMSAIKEVGPSDFLWQYFSQIEEGFEILDQGKKSEIKVSEEVVKSPFIITLIEKSIKPLLLKFELSAVVTVNNRLTAQLVM